MLARLKHLSGLSLTYGAGPLLIRAVGLLLIPIYTKHLSNADYGILSISTAIAAVLVGIMGFGLAQAALRFYYAATEETERRTIIGSIWTTAVLLAAGVTLLLFAIGPFISRYAFSDIPFYPFIFLAILIAFLQALQSIPLGLLRAQERARLFVAFSVGLFVLMALLSIALVAVLRQGATGALTARAVAQGLGAIAGSVIVLRYGRILLRRDMARSALLFGLPLIPTAFFGWLLRLSDRVIMQGFVGLDVIGVYALGYQIGETVGLVGTAINSAWAPFYYQTLEVDEQEAQSILSPIVTYWMFVLALAALALSLFAREIVLLIATPSYAAAVTIIPWIALASVVQAFTRIQRQGLLYAKVTKWDPIIYLIGGGGNVLLNLVTIPHFGPVAAAWNTVAGFALMALALHAVSGRLFRLDYEYRRLALLGGAAVAIYIVSLLFPQEALLADIAVKLVLLGLFPLLLAAMGFLSARELRALRKLPARVFGRAEPGS